jgi:hypothetical protein
MVPQAARISTAVHSRALPTGSGAGGRSNGAEAQIHALSEPLNRKNATYGPVANWVVNGLKAAGEGPSHVTAQENISPLPWSGNGTGCHRGNLSPRRCRHTANQIFATRVAYPTDG